jgi:hypothetical protein
MSRHERCWGHFIDHTFHLKQNKDIYQGILFINQRGVVDYSYGCFEKDFFLYNDSKYPIDPSKLVGIFERNHPQMVFEKESDPIRDLTKSKEQEQQQKDTENVCNVLPQQLDLFDEKMRIDLIMRYLPRKETDPSIQLGPLKFQVVYRSYVAVCAVSRGRKMGLIVEKVPFGTFLIAYVRPFYLQNVFPRVDALCAAMR